MRNKGFTLIEVIIVIVILGILAGLALPRIAKQAEAARAAEAMNMLGALKRAAIDCVDSRGDNDFANCNTRAALGLTPPGGAAFAYSISGTAPIIFCATRTTGGVAYSIALRVTLDNTANNTATIAYGMNPLTDANPYRSVVTRASGATAPFTSACPGTAL